MRFVQKWDTFMTPGFYEIIQNLSHRCKPVFKLSEQSPTAADELWFIGEPSHTIQLKCKNAFIEVILNPGFFSQAARFWKIHKICLFCNFINCSLNKIEQKIYAWPFNKDKCSLNVTKFKKCPKGALVVFQDYLNKSEIAKTWGSQISMQSFMVIRFRLLRDHCSHNFQAVLINLCSSIAVLKSNLILFHWVGETFWQKDFIHCIRDHKYCRQLSHSAKGKSKR